MIRIWPRSLFHFQIIFMLWLNICIFNHTAFYYRNEQFVVVDSQEQDGIICDFFLQPIYFTYCLCIMGSIKTWLPRKLAMSFSIKMIIIKHNYKMYIVYAYHLGLL